MTNTKNDTALLLFVNAANDGTKHLVSYKHQNRLFKFFNKKLINTAVSTGLRYFIVDSAHQVGSSFGERLANAMQSIFDKGFENVITLGNDCLTLSKNDIDAALVHLAEGKNVLGPDQKGGTYLIGQTRKSFDKSAFENLSWQTRDLLKELKRLMCEQSEAALLGQKSDTNTKADFQSQIKRSLPGSLKNILLQIAGWIPSFGISTNDRIVETHFKLLLTKRGPPVLA